MSSYHTISKIGKTSFCPISLSLVRSLVYEQFHLRTWFNVSLKGIVSVGRLFIRIGL